MNEFDFINALRKKAGTRKHSTRLVTGIGDDASVLREITNHDLVVTTDLIVEGIDFYRAAIPAELLGHKALAVSLSDIAAMGARPNWSLLSLGMPRETWSSSFRDDFVAGFLALADRFGVTLAGGDVSETRGGIVIDSIVLGEVAAGRAVLRSGARVGDQIYVTGNLGGAAAGLRLIEMGARVEQRSAVTDQRSEPPAGGPRLASQAPGTARDSHDDDHHAIQSLLRRQLQPQPRVGWGIVLGQEALASAMIDISDGLSSDLHHLCAESGTGATIDAASLPLNQEVKHLCGRRALDPLALALHGGEEFELLFTVAPENILRLPKKVDGISITRIGEITDRPGVIRLAESKHVWDLPAGGFEHFKG